MFRRNTSPAVDKRPGLSEDAPMAFEVLHPEGKGPFLFTCEHASNATFDHPVSAADRALLSQHWGIDIGAADLTRALSRQLEAPAVVAGFSRLLVDANRAPDDDTLFLREAHGQVIDFNRALTDDDKERRLERYYRPYHRAIRETARRALAESPRYLIAIHSFTPRYGDEVRTLEVGVLFDIYEDDARLVRDDLAAAGLEARLNEPYTGLGGLIYSIQHHAQDANARYLELEVRQDLIDAAGKADAMAARLAPALRSLAARTVLA